MQNRLNPLLMACGMAVAIVVAVSEVPGKSSEQIQQTETTHPNDASYKQIPILDPGQFREDHSAFVAYTVASELDGTLREVPCYCPCAQIGHKNLRDCFTGQHGALCMLCQKEAVYCYIERRKGKSSAQIRDGLSERKAMRLGLSKETNRLYEEFVKRKR